MPLHEVFDQVEIISNFPLLPLLVCEVCAGHICEDVA